MVDIEAQTRPRSVFDKRNQTHVDVPPGGFTWADLFNGSYTTRVRGGTCKIVAVKMNDTATMRDIITDAVDGVVDDNGGDEERNTTGIDWASNFSDYVWGDDLVADGGSSERRRGRRGRRGRRRRRRRLQQWLSPDSAESASAQATNAEAGEQAASKETVEGGGAQQPQQQQRLRDEAAAKRAFFFSCFRSSLFPTNPERPAGSNKTDSALIGEIDRNETAQQYRTVGTYNEHGTATLAQRSHTDPVFGAGQRRRHRARQLETEDISFFDIDDGLLMSFYDSAGSYDELVTAVSGGGDVEYTKECVDQFVVPPTIEALEWLMLATLLFLGGSWYCGLWFSIDEHGIVAAPHEAPVLNTSVRSYTYHHIIITRSGFVASVSRTDDKILLLEPRPLSICRFVHAFSHRYLGPRSAVLLPRGQRHQL